MKKCRGKPAFEMIIARGRGLVNGADKSLAGAWDGEDFFGYFFMEKKRRERGNREKKERKSKKNGII